MKIAIFEGYNGPGTIKSRLGTPAAPPRPYAGMYAGGLHGLGDVSTVTSDATHCSCSWSTPFLMGLAVATIWPFATRFLGLSRD